jgi:hypothetical protein
MDGDKVFIGVDISQDSLDMVHVPRDKSGSIKTAKEESPKL